MSCQDACVVMDYDGDTEFWTERVRRASKPYVCEECHDPIAAREQFVYVCGKSEGDFWSVRMCLACREIQRTFCCDGWVVSTLWEEVTGQLFPKWNYVTQIDCLARLQSEAAIAKMRAKYAEYVEDRGAAGGTSA